MPVPDFTPDNTAPDAIAAGDFAGTGGAAVAVNPGAFTPGNGAPVATELADIDPDNTAPTAKALADFAGTEVAPVPGSPGNFDGTAGAPVAANPGDYAGNNGAPVAGALGKYKPTNDAPGEVPVTDTELPAPTDSTMHTPSLQLVGAAALNQHFGYYSAPVALSILGLQIFAQEAPTGADLIVTLVNDDGDSLGESITLPAGEDRAKVTFDDPLAFLAGGIVRGKVTQIGSGEPGGYLTVTLISQLNS